MSTLLFNFFITFCNKINNLIIQWGEVTIAYNDYVRNVILPTSYTTAKYKGFITILNEGGGAPTNPEANARITARTSTNITIEGETVVGFTGMMWLTIGY